ncbi:Piwi domain-containing protein, partial [Blyttiomyces helicus]
PAHLIIYRDGVSEGEFERVLHIEKKGIKEACQAIEPGYKPSMTYIVVQKRHQARFRPANSREGDRHGNAKPGTVVDENFYLIAHESLQGTARPIHYFVLHDDHGFSSDKLQELTFKLCCLFGRATRIVSIVPPVYYAHLAAKRATLHFAGDWAAEGSESTTSSFASSWKPVQAGMGNTMFYV